MSDGTRSSDVSLERPARLRPSWRRRLLWPLLVAAFLLAIVGRNSDIAVFDGKSDCAASADNGQTALAVRTCQALFERTREPKDEMRLAAALVANGDVPEATRHATLLLETPAGADAFQLLGEIANTDDRLEDATRYLQAARVLHQTRDDETGVARDDGSLAVVHNKRSQFAEALQLLESCIPRMRRIHDAKTECYCRTVAAETLVQAGYFAAAKQQIDFAQALAFTEKAKLDIDYQEANYLQETGQYQQAIQKFEHVLKRKELARNTSWTVTTELNLAYSHAEQREFADAERHLDSAALLDPQHAQEPDWTWTAAQIAFRRHNLDLASSLIETYVQLLRAARDRGEDDATQDDQLDVETLRARIELERGDMEQARVWAQRAVDRAEQIRSAQSVLELRPWVLTKRRTCYELLFTALARSDQFEAATMVFAQWQGRTVQDALSRPRPSISSDFHSIAGQITERQTWLRTASTASFAKGADRTAVLNTMQEIDLIALIVAVDDVWLLTANHALPRLVRLGPLAEFSDRLGQFQGHPDDPDAADALGARFLPEKMFRATQNALHVIIDGRLEPLPVAALSHDRVPLIARRPIVRMLWLPEVRCAPPTPAGRATVIADPRHDLYNARIEAAQVAALLHATSVTGDAATKAALFDTDHNAVLHIATHGIFGTDGTTLALAGDEEVSAPEISARRLAPSLVVLSTCGSATSSSYDLEHAGSPFSGFLAAGAQRVVATLRPVHDVDALAVSVHFYLAGGVADPARGLARAQVELASIGNRDWPYFTVFGPDICRKEAHESP